MRTSRKLRSHAMYAADDLAYMRAKGYSDADVLAIWDRDAAAGCRPQHHTFKFPDVLGVAGGRRDR